MSSPNMGVDVRLIHASVRNPLADRTNVASHSGGCHISSDLDRDVVGVLTPMPLWLGLGRPGSGGPVH